MNCTAAASKASAIALPAATAGEAGASGLAAALAGASVSASMLTLAGDTFQQQPQYVIRGGLAKAENLIEYSAPVA
jgi:hypothetical protein